MKTKPHNKSPMQMAWLGALKTFGKIMLAVVICFFYATMSVFFISPMSAAKMYNFMGLKRAEEACYVRQYEQDGKILNLYNLVIFEMQQDSFEKELYYLNLLLVNDEYENFCKKLDESSLKSVKNKSLVAYSCNSNSFLINQKVKCMYNLNISSSAIADFVRAKLKNPNTAEYSLTTYVDLILADSTLNETQRQALLKSLYVDETIKTQLDSRISALENMASSNEITIAQKLIYQNALASNAKGKYLLLKAENADETKINEAKDFYENSYKTYRSLLV